MKKVLLASLIGLSLLSSISTANAALYLKSSGDQWEPAITDLQNSYNEGVASNNFQRFYNTLKNRFTLDEFSSQKDILEAFKKGADTSSQSAFNNSIGPGGAGGVTYNDYQKDQKRQDDALGQEIKDRKDGDKNLQDQINNHDDRITDLENNKPKDGIDGKDGKDGSDGKDGTNGKDGAKGDKGDKGDSGTNGTNGKDGKDGKDGRDADVSNLVTKPDFENDQARQDAALQTETDARIAGDAALDAKKVDKDVYAKDLASQAEKDAGQDKAISSNTAGIAENKSSIAAESKARSSADDALGVRIDNTNNRVSDVEQFAGENRAAIISTNKRVDANSAAIYDTNQRLSSLESSTNSRFRNLDKRIDKLSDKLDAGLSGVAAMANIPQVTESARFSVGAGLGARGDQSAVAVGFSSRITDNVIGKASVASDTQSQWTVGAGVAVQW